ncbi:MAG: PHB depolymerase family esterase [Casimicrobiaceae bacterium]
MQITLWSRIKARIARLFRHEPTPGRFESGSKFSVHGMVGTAPFVWPSRDYLVYVPKGRSAWRRAPLLVLCHGCKQTPEEVAQGTRIADLADRLGFVVLLPRQKESANPWRCWNWYEQRTANGNGETAIVAAQIRSVRRKYRIDRKRVIVAGMSAGGALAAAVGVRFPGLVAAVAVHSGLACGAATSAMAALTVMRAGPDQDVEAIAKNARAAAGLRNLRVPLLAIHGSGDPVVAPRNAVALVRQYLCLNDYPADNLGTDPGRLPPADAQRRTLLPGGRTEVVSEWRREGRLVARHIEIIGLGHAWSGGDTALPYNEAGLPDASALVGDFLADALS